MEDLGLPYMCTDKKQGINVGRAGVRTPPVTIMYSGLTQRGKPSFGFPEGSSASVHPSQNLFRTTPEGNVLEIFDFLSSRFPFSERSFKDQSKILPVRRHIALGVRCVGSGSQSGRLHTHCMVPGTRDTEPQQH